MVFFFKIAMNGDSNQSDGEKPKSKRPKSKSPTRPPSTNSKSNGRGRTTTTAANNNNSISSKSRPKSKSPVRRSGGGGNPIKKKSSTDSGRSISPIPLRKSLEREASWKHQDNFASTPQPPPSSGRGISPKPPTTVTVGNKQRGTSPVPPAGSNKKRSSSPVRPTSISQRSKSHKPPTSQRSKSPKRNDSNESYGNKQPMKPRSNRSKSPMRNRSKSPIRNLPPRRYDSAPIPESSSANNRPVSTDRLVNSTHSATRNKQQNKRARPPIRYNPNSSHSTSKDSSSRHSSNGSTRGGEGERQNRPIAVVEEDEEYDDVASFISDLDHDQSLRNTTRSVNIYDEASEMDTTQNTKTSMPPPSIHDSVHTRYHFPEDKWWQICLRYLRILPPVKQEGSTRRKVRISIWATLTLDFCVAIVSILTYGGEVTMCCGTPTMTSIPGIDFNLLMNIIAYIYLVGIILEIVPVVREGPIPWNLLNPIFGSALSFAVFVDDSKAEAISIWVLELGTVILEFYTYIKLRKLHRRAETRLERLSQNIESYELSERDPEKPRLSAQDSYRNNYNLRERRTLRIEHAASEMTLRYHFIGVTVNFTLVGLTLLLIILVARGGGMCKVGGVGLDLFNTDQKGRCGECISQFGAKERCQLCNDPPEGMEPSEDNIIQCYYPYF